MITPIGTLNINQICERKDDLLVSSEDIKALARNERNKAIDDVFEFLKNKRDKKHLKVNLDDLEIRIYKEQLKEGAE